MFLYHGTSTKRLESIKEKGLDPKAQKASSGHNYVYLTDSPEIAARFSGLGPDAMGMIREGYMASNDAKAKTGVVLKVKIPNPKKLAPDAIWSKELKKLNGKSAYQKAYDEVAQDLERGNQVLDSKFDGIMHKLCKEMADGDEEDFQVCYENPTEELIEQAQHLLCDQYAKKEQASVEREIEFFNSGKLYQYPDLIPPEAIVEVLPAKKYLGKSDERSLGNPFTAYASTDFLVRLERLIIAEEDYQGEHTAPSRDSGAPLHNLANVYPEDFYSPMGARYYGDGQPYDQESWRILSALRGKPNTKVRIYRAVPYEPSTDERLEEIEKALKFYLKYGKPPKEFQRNSYDEIAELRDELKKAPKKDASFPEINKGDWVTINKTYARDHGLAALKGKFKIRSKLARASDVFTNGDSLHEQGYDP